MSARREVAFGGSVGVFSLVLAYTTRYLAQALPIPVGATEGVDAARTFTGTAAGVSVEIALLGVVAHRVFTFWLPIGSGIRSVARFARPDWTIRRRCCPLGIPRLCGSSR